jgi:uncharacterized Ntn-hydrolase superfamily protein
MTGQFSQSFLQRTDPLEPTPTNNIEKIHQMLETTRGGTRGGKDKITLDIVRGCEVQCLTDQKCSRFVQKRLDDLKVSIDEKNRFFDMVLKNDEVDFESIITDSFGNYVIQKILQVP